MNTSTSKTATHDTKQTCHVCAHISSIYSRHHHSSDDRSAIVAERSVSPQSVFTPNKTEE